MVISVIKDVQVTVSSVQATVGAYATQRRRVRVGYHVQTEHVASTLGGGSALRRTRRNGCGDAATAAS